MQVGTFVRLLGEDAVDTVFVVEDAGHPHIVFSRCVSVGLSPGNSLALCKITLHGTKVRIKNTLPKIYCPRVCMLLEIQVQ